ncbi:hypothetical protein P9X10_01100 [Bacillus cereus]|nr:hypothetical protein [Bacillus cereus]
MDEITTVRLDERKAIEDELEFIREQMREDREMYVKSRNMNLQRQEHLLNRLSNLDERDISLRREERLHELNKSQLTLTDTNKVVKQPKSTSMSPVDLQVERVVEKDNQEQEETRVLEEPSVMIVEDKKPIKEGVKSPLTRENIKSISKGLEELKIKRDKEKKGKEKTEEVKPKVKNKKEEVRKGRKKNVMKSKRIPSKDVVTFLEGVLRGSEPKDANKLKALAEEYFDNEWTSFYDMLYTAVKTSDFIVRDKKIEGKNITYSYDETKRQQTTE